MRKASLVVLVLLVTIAFLHSSMPTYANSAGPERAESASLDDTLTLNPVADASESSQNPSRNDDTSIELRGESSPIVKSYPPISTSNTASAGATPTPVSAPKALATNGPGNTFLPLIMNATGRTYYVATTGNDSGPGTLINPWKTIQKAANTIIAGDTVYIRGGIYNEQVIPKNSGAPGSYITYASFPGETVTIDGSGLTLGTWDGLFWVRNKSHIRVSGLRVMNAGTGYFKEGVRVDYSSNIIVAGNYTYNTTSSGIGIWGSNNIVVDGNEIVLACNGGYNEDLSVDGSDHVEVKNNNVHNGFNSPYGGEGINIKNGSSNVTVHHNTVHDSPKLAFGLDGWMKYTHDIAYYDNIAYNNASGFIVESEQGGTVENVQVYNNIAYNNRGPGFYIPNWEQNDISLKKNITFINNTSYGNGSGISILSTKVQGVVIRNNILSPNVYAVISIVPGAQAQTTEDHNLTTGDPKYVNPAGGDFHLQPGSPAIDAGSPLNAPTSDFDGNPRPRGAAFDIGAFEY